LADLQRTVYPHSGHPLAEGRVQDRVSKMITICGKNDDEDTIN